MDLYGDFVKKIRLEKRLTLREFCRRANIDSGNWSRIERGVMPPPRKKGWNSKVSKALGLDTMQAAHLDTLVPKTYERRIEIAISALKFYADRKTYYMRHDSGDGFVNKKDIDFDLGEKAREAINAIQHQVSPGES